MKTTSALGAGAIWIGSMIGCYLLGKNQGITEGTTLSKTELTAAANSAAASKSHGKPSRDSATGSKEGGPDTLPVKEILAKLKAMTRMGGMMQNPNSMMKLMSLLDKLRPEDFQEALAEAEGMTDQQSKMMLYTAVLGKWAEKDGPAAMQYAQEHSKDMGMMGAMSKMSVASAWAENDPEAVWKWYNDTKDGEDSGPMGGQMVLMSLFSSLAAKNPEMAFKRLEEIDGPGKQMALAGMFQAAMFDDDKRAAILKQVEAMPDATERQQAKQSMLSQWAMMAPDQAIEYVKIQSAEDQKNLRSSMGMMMMMQNPKKGAAFMMDGATDEDRSSRYENVINGWAHQDPNAAGTWLNEQPKGPQLDHAKRSFVMATAEKDPTSAMVWAGTITEPETRQVATEHAYEVWKKKDPAAAEAALNSSGLTPEQIQAIRTKAPTPTPTPLPLRLTDPAQ